MEQRQVDEEQPHPNEERMQLMLTVAITAAFLAPAGILAPAFFAGAIMALALRGRRTPTGDTLSYQASFNADCVDQVGLLFGQWLAVCHTDHTVGVVLNSGNWCSLSTVQLFKEIPYVGWACRIP
jgi:hypothetical protein